MLKYICSIFLFSMFYDYSTGVIYEHHMISRQQLLNRCFQRYVGMVEDQCTYPDQLWPCLNGTTFVNGKVYQPYKLETIALRCCLMRCSEYDVITTYCCSTRDCMKQCYDLEIPESNKNFYFFGK